MDVNILARSADKSPVVELGVVGYRNHVDTSLAGEGNIGGRVKSNIALVGRHHLHRRGVVGGEDEVDIDAVSLVKALLLSDDDRYCFEISRRPVIGDADRVLCAARASSAGPTSGQGGSSGHTSRHRRPQSFSHPGSPAPQAPIAHGRAPLCAGYAADSWGPACDSSGQP